MTWGWVCWQEFGRYHTINSSITTLHVIYLTKDGKDILAFCPKKHRRDILYHSGSIGNSSTHLFVGSMKVKKPFLFVLFSLFSGFPVKSGQDFQSIGCGFILGVDFFMFFLNLFDKLFNSFLT